MIFSKISASPDGTRLTFDVKDVDLCVVNSIRRCIMSDVPTAAFMFDATAPLPEDEGVHVLKNTSTLHNEFIGHRFSLVPIGFTEDQLRVFDPKDFKFVLKAACPQTQREPIAVTTGDIEVFDKAGAKYPQAVRDALFPPCPVTGDHILLLRLRPGPPGQAGEEVHMEARARLGTGKQHTRWSPVSKCYFRNKIDSKLAETTLERRLEEEDKARADAGKAPMSEDEKRRIRMNFNTLDAHRCFFTNGQGDPSEFEFVVDCEAPRLRPQYLVFKALLVLQQKVARILTDVKALKTAKTSDDPSTTTTTTVSMETYPNMDDFFCFTIHGEDHTIGNLLQGLLYKRWIMDGQSSVVSYVGYYQPHPLEPYIFLKIKSAVPGDDVVERFAEGVSWVRSVLEELTIEWINAANMAAMKIVEVNEFIVNMKRRSAADVVKKK